MLGRRIRLLTRAPEADLGLMVDQLEGVLYYRMLWRYAPLDQADVEATIDALMHGAAA